MDNIQLRTGQLFKGIRDLPVGAHYIYHNTGQGVSGFFLYIEKQNVQVRKWNSDYECYERLRSDDEELFVSNVEELYPMMVSYPSDKLKLWEEMTNFIDKNVVLHLEPSSHAVYRSEVEYDSIETEFETFSAMNAPFYSTIPKRMRGYGMSPEEITTRNMDKSYILYDLIHSLPGEDRLLGEMQYSFLSFLLGQSLESFEQWKEIFILVCNCEKALQDSSNFYTKLIRNLQTAVMYSELVSISEDLLEDTFLSTSFISVSLRVISIQNFLELLSDSSLPIKLYNRGQKFKNLLNFRFGIVDKLMQMQDEEAPTIVDFEETSFSF